VNVRGAPNVEARAYGYAFGVMLFEAMTGPRPFEAETYNELILKIATEPSPNAFELNPSLNTELIDVIERAMARDPEQRIQTIEELALALEPFAGGARFRTGRHADPALISGDFPLPRSTTGDSTTLAKSLPARTPQQASVPIEPPRKRNGALMIGVAAAALLVGLGLGALLLRDGAKHDRQLSIAHPAPQPTAAGADTVPPAPAPQKLETSMSAMQQGVSAPADPDTSAQRAAMPAPKAPKQHPAAALPNKRWLSDPPAPEAIPAPAPSKRAPPKDWDDRLTVDTPHTSDAPAGRIDTHDFR
jgi:serine/threonine-protein kinase